MPPPSRPAAAPFTVIELLTVIALVVMLTVIVLPLLAPAKKAVAPPGHPPAATP